jgi:hypothetical protein
LSRADLEPEEDVNAEVDETKHAAAIDIAATAVRYDFDELCSKFR